MTMIVATDRASNDILIVVVDVATAMLALSIEGCLLCFALYGGYGALSVALNNTALA